MKTETRRSPTGTDWTYVRSYLTAGRYRVICARSDAGATKYLGEDEWEDWAVV